MGEKWGRNGKWIHKPAENCPVIKSGEELRILTYNVWFDQLYEEERRDAIFHEIQSLSPHIVCLQEVLPEFIKALIQQTWAQENYYLSDATGDFVSPYGCCILSRMDVTNFSAWLLPTMMGRSCLIAEFQIDNNSFLCATVHLESLDSRNLRQKQLEVISSILKDSHTALLMGDFNMDSDINYSQLERRRSQAADLEKDPRDIDYPQLRPGEILENDAVVKHFSNYEDVWKYLRPDEDGYTFNSEINPMIHSSFEQMRYDRILFRTTDNLWTPTNIKLFGTERIPNLKSKYPILMSDHFGLLLQLKYNKPN